MLGPWTESSVVPDVTSVTVTCSPGSDALRTIGSTRRCMMSDATTRKRSSANRVTVRSAAMPPFGVSHCV